MIAHAGHRSGLGMPESSRGAWTQIWKLESFDEEIRFVGLSRHSGRGGMSQRFKPGDKLTLKCGLWSSWGIRARRGDAAVFLRYTPLPKIVVISCKGYNEVAVNSENLRKRRAVTPWLDPNLVVWVGENRGKGKATGKHH